MSVPVGTKQKTYYVREDYARIMAMIASRDDKRESELVNEAFEQFISTKLTKEERRVFGYKEKDNATGQDSSRANGTDAKHSGRNGIPPGKRVRPADVARSDRKQAGAQRRSSKREGAAG